MALAHRATAPPYNNNTHQTLLCGCNIKVIYNFFALLQITTSEKCSKFYYNRLATENHLVKGPLGDKATPFNCRNLICDYVECFRCSLENPGGR